MRKKQKLNYLLFFSLIIIYISISTYLEEEDEAETEESEAESVDEKEKLQTGRKHQHGAPRVDPQHGAPRVDPTLPVQNTPPAGQAQQFVTQGRLPTVQIPQNMMMRPPAPQILIYPVPMGPNQFQPVYPGGPVQQQEQTKSSSPKMPSREPPTYSHLVQRGYNPQGGRNSPSGRSTPGSHGSDPQHHRSGETEFSEASLPSGVELMRR